MLSATPTSAFVGPGAPRSLRSLRGVLAAGLALAALALVGRWLDRPQIRDAVEVRGDGSCTLRMAAVMPPGIPVLTPVWAAEIETLTPTAVRLTFVNVPTRVPLAIAMAGPARDQVHIRWTAGTQAPAGEMIVRIPSRRWEIFPLPTLDRPGQEITFEITLRSPADKFQLSRPFLTDALHGPTARHLGRLATALAAFGWIAVLATTAALFLQRSPAFSGQTLVVAAWFVVASAGYLLFWAYFAHPVLGDACVFALLLLVGGTLWLRAAEVQKLWADRAWRCSWLSVLGVGLLFFGFLHAWITDAPWSWLAANRYNPGLPSDNSLPQLFAEFLLHGRSPRHVDFEWVSSDRPPLQTGWILLLGPLLRTSTYHYDSLCQAMGLWLQLLWVPAIGLLYARFGESLRRALLLTFAVGLSAFVVVNTQFVWPKLAGGAFALAGWLLLAPANGSIDRNRALLGGLGLALGYLSHGGVAFSILALLPLCLLPLRLDAWRARLAAAVLAAAVCAPWLAYQRFYQPPGNHLLKWHLAGVVPIDDRGTWQTLRDSYRAKTWAELCDIRHTNLRYVFLEDEWPQLWNVAVDALQPQRSRDFFHLARSIGWWNLGLIVLPLAWWKQARRARAPDGADLSLLLRQGLLWIAFTLLVWIALMFERYGTCIHQGSYVPPLLLLALAVWSLHAVHPLLLLAVTVPAGSYFAVTYGFSAPSGFRTTVDPAAVVITVAGALVMSLAIISVRRTEPKVSLDPTDPR